MPDISVLSIIGIGIRGSKWITLHFHQLTL